MLRALAHCFLTSGTPFISFSVWGRNFCQHWNYIGFKNNQNKSRFSRLLSIALTTRKLCRWITHKLEPSAAVTNWQTKWQKQLYTSRKPLHFEAGGLLHFVQHCWHGKHSVAMCDLAKYPQYSADWNNISTSAQFSDRVLASTVATMTNIYTHIQVSP